MHGVCNWNSKDGMNIALVEHQGFVKAWYWASSSPVRFDIGTGVVIVGDGHALRVDPVTHKCIYPTYLCDPKFKAVNDPMVVVSPDIGLFVYKDKSANLPYYPSSAVRLATMHNSVRSIPSHNRCYICKASVGELLSCNFCLLTHHRDCTDSMVFIYEDVVHVKKPQRLDTDGMCKCCSSIRFQNSA